MAWSTRELARIAGTTENSVRYYHRVGLLPHPERATNGYKRYEVAHLVQLLRIRRLRELGVPVKRIAGLAPQDPDAQESIRALDAELEARIEQLVRVREDLAQLTSHSAPLETPAGFAAFAAQLSPTQQSLLAIYAQVFDARTLAAFRQALVHQEDTDVEFDRLPAAADDAAVEDLARRMVVTNRRQLERFPELAGVLERSPLGRATAGLVLAHALVDLYNTAQLRVLRRVDTLMLE
ncbi:MerR family transcriptional regulator [Nocardioides sp. NPDC127503]|uniref:MerR family transcriptional regulator n=1 Tax=Nocardioides sp. NPDC127503 TaxID=3154516 RepID=UPI003330DBF5